jgi:hypothetical protein
MNWLDNMQVVDLNRAPVLRKQAKALYHTAFPKEERLPWWLLRLNARRSGIDLTAFLDGDTFCGFTASVTVENMHFLLFFAPKTARKQLSAAFRKEREKKDGK